MSAPNRLVGIFGLHSQCVSELCALCEASCSPAALVRLLQYYSGWAQLRDTLIPGWTPVGEKSAMLCHFFIFIFSRFLN